MLSIARRARREFFWLIIGSVALCNYVAATPILRYEVVARYPHPAAAFTQGLELNGDTLYESSGLYQRSYIVAWHLQDQTPQSKQTLPDAFFGEGLTLWNDRIYVLTWREQRGFIFDKTTFKKIGEFSYDGEGWGLTHNDNDLIMSDGSATLRVLNPQTLQVEKTIAVTEDGKSIDNLNELEWIPAHEHNPQRLLANIWQTDSIAVIDPTNGNVTARFDLTNLYPKSTRNSHADVLNGIALDPRDHTLLITGKFWPFVYRVRLLDPLP